MTAFLQFILIVAIVIPIIMIVFTVFFLKRFFGSVRNMKEQMNGRYRNTKQGYGQQRTYPNDEMIIDRRTTEQANQKIFDKNEGEYVEFTEEK